MSVSTDGIIAFGILFKEGEAPWQLEEDEDGNFEGWEDWFLSKIQVDEDCSWRAKDRALENLGLTVENYCSGDYPMYALVVKESIITAWRGRPKRIDPRGLVETTMTYRTAFQRGCELLRVTFPVEPEWLLMSYWG